MDSVTTGRVEFRFSVAQFVAGTTFFVILTAGVFGAQLSGFILPKYTYWIFDIVLPLSLVCAAYRGWQLRDRTPVIVLDRTGICDRRLAPVVFPWAQIKTIQPVMISGLYSRTKGVVLHFAGGFIAPESTQQLRQIFIDLLG